MEKERGESGMYVKPRRGMKREGILFFWEGVGKRERKKFGEGWKKENEREIGKEDGSSRGLEKERRKGKMEEGRKEGEEGGKGEGRLEE